MDEFDLAIKHAIDSYFGLPVTRVDKHVPRELVMIDGDDGPAIAPEREYPPAAEMDYTEN